MPCCLVLLDTLCFNEMRKIRGGGRVGYCGCGRLMKLYCLSAAVSGTYCWILCHVSHVARLFGSKSAANVGLCSSLFDVNKHIHHLPTVCRVEREQERPDYDNVSDQQHTTCTNNVGTLTS